LIDKCKDCNAPIDTSLLEENEIVVCSDCGSEYQYKNGELVLLELDGEDFGE
jgi:DNA-directed RNA polymerase subunit RPC12/RpoP